MTQRFSLALTFVLTTLFATSAGAETRLTVDEFDGPHARSVRAEVENVLQMQEDVTVVSKREVEAKARRMDVDLDTPEGRRAVARELKLSAWITGKIKERHHKLRLSVVVHDGAEYTRVGRTSVSGRSVTKLRSAVRHKLWRKSKEAVSLALAPLPKGRAPVRNDDEDEDEDDGETAVAEAEPARQKSPGQTDEESASKTAALASAEVTPVSTAARSATLAHDDSALSAAPRRRNNDTARAFVGFGSPYRSFAYSDPITSSLGDYRLSGAPMFDLGLQYFPGRHLSDGWISWIGIEAAGQLALGSSTKDRDGNEYTSRYSAYRVGVRGRVPVGKHSLSVFSGYAMSRLLIEAEGNSADALTPDVDYRSVRSGAGTELALSDSFMLGFDAAWLKVLSVGEIATWFPRASVGGLELTLAATYALSEHFFARMSATYQRTFYDFNARPGDERVAGGATDQFVTASVGMGVSL